MKKYEYLKKTVTQTVAKKQVVIVEGNGYVERAQYSGDLTEKMLELWLGCIETIDGKKPTEDDLRKMLLPDLRTLAIEIRKLNYGEELRLMDLCLKCGKPGDYVVNIAELEFTPLPEDATPPDPTWEKKLPRTGMVAVHGYVTAQDWIDEENTSGFDPIRLAFRHVRSLDGAKCSYEDVVLLPLRDQEALREDILSKRCGYNTLIHYRHACGQPREQDLLADPNCMWPGLKLLRLR